MSEIVGLILSLSLSGSILAVLIFALKPIIRYRLPRWIQYYIWIIVLLRLTVPFSFETSLVNEWFYDNQTPVVISTPSEIQTAGENVKNNSSLSSLQNVQENAAKDTYYEDSDHRRYFQDLFYQYVLILWLLGVIITLMFNFTAYARFSKRLRQASQPAAEEEERLLMSLLRGRDKVKLVRNIHAPTPMLIGMFRPEIIIPDMEFSEKQLKNILLHELTHLRRLDIAIKWLTLITISIHWFNPLMVFIKREINRACELSCDEAVIKNLDAKDKQAYGDILISVVSEHKYPGGVLSTTMCEEKKSLKERLVAIMKHRKKSKFIVGLSVLLLAVFIGAALILGAGVGNNKNIPPNIYIGSEFEKTKEALTGKYVWKDHDEYIYGDAGNTKDLGFNDQNTVNVAASEQLILSTRKIKMDKRYPFTLEELKIYKNDRLTEMNLADPSYMNDCLYLQAPAEAGNYTYCLTLKYEQGTVDYGFVVRVGKLEFNLTEIAEHKTPYIGNSSKVSALVSLLPEPDTHFQQHYISLLTDSRPYTLNVFYETKTADSYNGEWPMDNQEGPVYFNLHKNALVLFSMIDNLDQVTFQLRNSPSTGDLDVSKYDTSFTFERDVFERDYGDLQLLGEDLEALQNALELNRDGSV